MKITKEEIESCKTANGGWTKEQLAKWGIDWPPPLGWKKKLVTDPRHTSFQGLIFRCYMYLNDNELPPWDGSEAKQLSILLKNKPDWDEKKFAICLWNYARSEITRGDRPRIFLPRLTSYQNGPLDKYGKEKRYDETKEAARDRRNCELLERYSRKRPAQSCDIVLQGPEPGTARSLDRVPQQILKFGD